MKPSQYHGNRQLYNWSVYKTGDQFLEKYSDFFRGNLYDLGCADAPYKEYFLQYADSYTGVDWTKTQHNSKADIVSDLNKKIELEDGVADSIVSLSVMEHLYQPQVFLNEANRILKSGGVMVLQVPWQWWVHEAPHDYFRYTEYGLKYLFETAQFKNVTVEPVSGFFSMLFVKLNYFTLRLIKGPRLIKKLLRCGFIPLWATGQWIAPYLDKLLDENWSAETQAYYVVAHKE